MILRRFMSHIKDQNWFAVGLDVLVVIVGIFLGLQVQAWYDRQNDYEVETRTVGYLITDIENTISNLERANTRFDALIQAEIRLLQLLEQEQLTEQDIPPFDNSIFLITKNPPIEGFFNGFTEENISKIQNERLKRVIGSYLDRKNDEFNLVDMVYNIRFPISATIIVEKALVSESTNVGILKNYDFDQLKTDNQFKRAIGHIISDSTVLKNVVVRLLENSKLLHEALKNYQSGTDAETIDFLTLDANLSERVEAQ